MTKGCFFLVRLLTLRDYFDLLSLPILGDFSIMYAVLETGGKQYRVKSGDKFEIERLNVEAGQSVTFDKILLINQDGNFKVGTPTVESATVVADVLLHKKGPKVTSFKMRRRKGYQKTIGHRQQLTLVQVKEINA